MDSLAQPACILVYIGAIQHQKASHLSSLWVYTQASQVLSSLSPQSLCVVVCPWYSPWVASEMREAAEAMRQGSAWVSESMVSRFVFGVQCTC